MSLPQPYRYQHLEGGSQTTNGHQVEHDALEEGFEEEEEEEVLRRNRKRKRTDADKGKGRAHDTQHGAMATAPSSETVAAAPPEPLSGTIAAPWSTSMAAGTISPPSPGAMRATPTGQPAAAMDWARRNEMQEAAAMSDARLRRTRLLAPSTLKAYQKYEAHWNDWCIRNHYIDRLVTKSRFLRYMSENLADDNGGNERVQPLRKVRRKNDMSTEPLPLGGRLKPETVDFYIKSAVHRYDEQVRQSPLLKSQDEMKDSPRNKDIEILMKEYRLKIAALTLAVDRPGLQVTDTYTMEGFKRILKQEWARNYTQLDKQTRIKLKGFRDRLMSSWQHFLVCRGEVMRMAKLSDLQHHVYECNDRRGQFTLGVVLTILQGKTTKDGHAKFGAVIRNVDVELCPVACLALYLLELFSEPRSPPDFSQCEWERHHLVFTTNPLTMMSAATHYGAQRQEMLAANVQSSKVTYAGRRAAAQQAQASGASIQSIAQHGGWLYDHIGTRCLSEIPQDVPLNPAGFTGIQERLWLPRSTLLPPIELQRHVFPFIEGRYPGNKDWAIWMENIMMDRQEYYGRDLDTASIYPKDDDASRRFLILLAHLRKVVVQDAAILLDIDDDSNCIYRDHHIFELPIFRSALFLQFRMDLKAKMAMSTSPLSDSLLANTPALHGEFRSLNTKLDGILKLINTGPRRTELQRDREVWTSTVDSCIQQLQNNTISMHDSLITLNNNAEKNVYRLLNTMKSIADAAASIVKTSLLDPPGASSSVPSLSVPPLTASSLFVPPLTASSLSVPSLSASSSSSTTSLPTPSLSVPSLSIPSLSATSLPVPSSSTISSSATSLSAMSLSTPLMFASSSSMMSSSASFSVTSGVRAPDAPGAPDIPDIPATPATPDAPLLQPHPVLDELTPEGYKCPLTAMGLLAAELAWPRVQPHTAAYTMLTRKEAPTIRLVFQEWFYGVGGQPSIWQMDTYHGPGRTAEGVRCWRANKGANERQLYKYKKTLVDSVLAKIGESPSPHMSQRKEYGLRAVEEMIASEGSLNQYFQYVRDQGKAAARRAREESEAGLEANTTQ